MRRAVLGALPLRLWFFFGWHCHGIQDPPPRMRLLLVPHVQDPSCGERPAPLLRVPRELGT